MQTEILKKIICQKNLVISVLMTIFLFVTAPLVFSATKPLPAFHLKKITNTVWAALKPMPHRIVDSNVVIIASDHCLTIVDANENLTNVDKLIVEIKQLSKQLTKPVCYVINTHWHLDHILGNQRYQQSFPKLKSIIGHHSLTQTIPTKAQKMLNEKIQQWQSAITNAEEKLKASEDKNEMSAKIERAKAHLATLKNTQLITPDVTFKSTMELAVSGTQIKLLNFGKAHTEGDTIVYLPNEKILVSGDLFDHLPFAGHGFPSDWLHTLNEIEKLYFDKVIPGHGKIQLGKASLIRIKNLLADSLKKAKKAVADNQSLDDFMAEIDQAKLRENYGELDDLGERAFKQFIPEFYRRAYKEAKGEL